MSKKKKRKIIDDYRQHQLRLMYTTIIFTVVILAAGIILWCGFHSEKNRLRKEGISFYKAGRYESALQYFDEALAEKQWCSGETDLDCRMYRAASLFHLERYSESAEQYQKILNGKHHKEDEIWLSSMAELASTMQAIRDGEANLSELIPTLTEAVERGEDKLNLYLGEAYLSAGDEENMKQAFLKYAEKYGMNTFIAYQVSTYDLKMNNLSDAESEIRQGLAAKDNLYKDLLKYNEVVLIEKQKPGDYAAALEEMEFVILEYPDNEIFKQEYEFLYNRVHVDENPMSLKEELTKDDENTEEK